MRTRRIRTLEVIHYLGMEEEGVLTRLREEGLFESDELEPEEADELRLAALLMQELGVNAAGVEVALHLRRRLFALEERARALAEAIDPKRRR